MVYDSEGGGGGGGAPDDYKERKGGMRYNRVKRHTLELFLLLPNIETLHMGTDDKNS